MLTCRPGTCQAGVPVSPAGAIPAPRLRVCPQGTSDTCCFGVMPCGSVTAGKILRFGPVQSAGGREVGAAGRVTWSAPSVGCVGTGRNRGREGDPNFLQ